MAIKIACTRFYKTFLSKIKDLSCTQREYITEICNYLNVSALLLR